MRYQPNPSSVRFGPFELDVLSGELRNDERSQVVERLPPQPTRLLACLIERAPDLVTRDEIRQLLWPDVEVEFEESLHSCIRKIRLALGDSASTPVFVETVPRRGYRFIGPVGSTSGSDLEPTHQAGRSWSRWALVSALALTLLGVAAFGYRATRIAAVESIRIAVMPSPLSLAASDGGGLAESIVRLLMDRAPAIEVIGPTTTDRYVGRIRVLMAEFNIDHVVNMREAGSKDGVPTRPRILIEIIRSRDGAHVWVRYLDELPVDGAAQAIADAAIVGARANDTK